MPNRSKKELTQFEKEVTNTLIQHDAVEFISQTNDKNLFMDPKKAQAFLKETKEKIEELYQKSLQL